MTNKLVFISANTSTDKFHLSCQNVEPSLQPGKARRFGGIKMRLHSICLIVCSLLLHLLPPLQSIVLCRISLTYLLAETIQSPRSLELASVKSQEFPGVLVHESWGHLTKSLANWHCRDSLDSRHYLLKQIFCSSVLNRKFRCFQNLHIMKIIIELQIFFRNSGSFIL